MSTSENAVPKVIRDRLLSLTIRPRRIHEHPLVLVPRADRAFSYEELFGPDNRDGENILELGSGWGEFALAWLEKRPDDCYVAVEANPHRLGGTARRAERKGLNHLRLLPVNFNWFLEEFLPARAFDRIIVNFPDPWPKRRHWKHRLVDARFPGRAENLLRPGGVVHIATDHGPYARRILGVFRRAPSFGAQFPFPHYVRSRPAGILPTRFEEIHLSNGLRPYYQAWVLRESTLGR